ncbi:MAG: LysE family transporter [Hespellia sp.]|nr:LysE family transporter [Hespellia sp.]
MPVTIIPSFLIYCYITGVTPGPANLCSLSTALHYGKKTALRQWRGLFWGYFIVSMCAVLITRVIGTVFNQYVGYLSWIGAAYILWLAWHTFHSSEYEEKEATHTPDFFTGMCLQFTNVKIMVSCTSALSCYVLPYTDSFWVLLGAGLFLPFTGPMANLLWLYAGASLQNIFRNYQKQVDTVMAVSLVLCAVTLVWTH